MDINAKNELISVIKNNQSWALLIEGNVALNFENTVNLIATIPSGELGVMASENGNIYPEFAKNIDKCSKGQKRVFLCITGLDEISKDDQDKFCGMLKNKGINGYKFPENTQILIPVKNLENVSKKISDLCIIYKVK